jgi:multidrug efflux pump subunit AcrB
VLSLVNLTMRVTRLLMVKGHRTCLIYQAPGSNAIETADNVTATMDELKKAFPKDIDYVVPFESVTVVKVSLDEVIETLVIALVLVIVVVFLFLQNWRTTLIPVLAIPVSIVGTFIFFIPLGFTINTLNVVWFRTGYWYCGG